MNGALLIDKPSGPTSHDIVSFTRRLLGTRRVGHTGTLDPLATGLLVMLIGHATRLSQFLVSDEKAYIADVRLGIATRTYDAASLEEAEVRGPRSEARVTLDQVRRVLPDFLGTFPQLPPPFSAKKVDGVRAYEKARKNEQVDLKPVEVTVHELELLEPRTSDLGPRTSNLEPRTSDLVRLRVVSSAGFYVRSLAHDLGQVLGCGGHLEALRRTQAGRFRVEDAATLDVLEAEGNAAARRIVPMNALLGDLPAVGLTQDGLRRAGNGNTLAPGHLSVPLAVRAGDRVRILGADGEVLSVAEQGPDGLLHPLLVLR